MKKTMYLLTALALGCCMQPAWGQKKAYTVDTKTVYQEIDNFSASDLSLIHI